MAAPYYMMPGSKFPTQGGLPVLVDQTDFDACCCAPCTGCAGAQSDRTVSLAGACDDSAAGCNGSCSPICCNSADDGNYVYQGFDAGTCTWTWQGPAADCPGGTPWYLVIRYAASTWTVKLTTGAGGADLFHDLDSLDISCVGGLLTGTLTLSGPSGYKEGCCTGITATVTVTV